MQIQSSAIEDENEEDQDDLSSTSNKFQSKRYKRKGS